MSTQHQSYTHPAFGLRYPLGKAFTSAGLKPHSATRPRTATGYPSSSSASHHADPSATVHASPPKRNQSSSAPKSRTTGDEYIKNLQQQVYLLELETRYLRAGRPDDGTPFPLSDHGHKAAATSHSPEPDRPTPAAPLGEVIQDLKSKYVELQEGYRREVETLRTDLLSSQSKDRRSSQLAKELKSQVDTLSQQVHALQSGAARERETVLVELSATKQRLEATEAEVARWETLHEHSVTECEELRRDAITRESALMAEKDKTAHVSKLTAQLSSAESATAALSTRSEQLAATNHGLTARLTVAGARIAESDTRAAGLAAELTRATAARTGLSDRLGSLTAATAAQTTRIAALDAKVTVLTADAAKAAQTCGTHLKELEAVTAAKVALDSETTVLRARVAAVRRVEELVRVCEERGEGYIEVVKQLKGSLRDGGVWNA
ncbi:hypothetical protein HKX48_006415 [Thoreauomyces humboldtii]|nr:hypothetical protein HKX48_006415 [Thoreauomyces humboldtii]